MKYEIPSQTLRLWQLRATALTALFILICIMLTNSAIITVICICIVLITFVLIIFAYLPQLFKASSCKITDSSVIFETGVFIKRIHIFPLTRLIYTRAYKTPLSAIMGLSAVSLKAARNRIIIPELLDSDVEILLSVLTGGECDEA